MSYIENPKTKGSGIKCVIPQTGTCPMGCDDCFFQSGRSFLEPLDDNLPNMISDYDSIGNVIRVNDGNDSNNDQMAVIDSCASYNMKFFNTSIPMNLEKFEDPVVLTVNPGQMTDTKAHLVDPIPKNLMMVRVRTNLWNLDLVDQVVEYYTEKEIPVILTFMAYFGGDIPEEHKNSYVYRKRTLNSYNAITTVAWESVMEKYKYNKWVYSCGKIEGEKGSSVCHRCGNCLREYFHTKEKLA